MLLECRNLKKNYGKKQAVRNITLNLERGKIYGLLGPNGSGKTTWMKMTAGLVKGWEGSISFEVIRFLIMIRQKLPTCRQSHSSILI